MDMEDSRVGRGVDSCNNMANGSRKRVSDFLKQCCEAKKCKLDLERQLFAKRVEKKRYEDQIRIIKAKILRWTQQMNAKEAILDTINQQMESLTAEHSSATNTDSDFYTSLHTESTKSERTELYTEFKKTSMDSRRDDGRDNVSRDGLATATVLRDTTTDVITEQQRETSSIDRVDDSFLEAVNKINCSGVVGLDSKGKDIGRKGLLSLIQISTEKCVYIFDILTIGYTALELVIPLLKKDLVRY